MMCSVNLFDCKQIYEQLVYKQLHQKRKTMQAISVLMSLLLKQHEKRGKT